MPTRKPAADATLAALYKAVLANPDDDLPRLVYADRLDELGDHPRAEFIRLQIHVANTEPWEEGHADALVKSNVLYERHKETWGIEALTRELMRTKDVRPGVFNPFVRGFPEVTWANIETFSAAHRKALKKYPIRELVLVGGPSPAVARLGELLAEVAPGSVRLGWTWWNVFPALTNCPPLPSLRDIALSRDVNSASVEVIEQFAASANFPNVETVRFGSEGDEARLLAFVRNLRWPKVRDVYLHGEFTPRVQAALAGAPWVGQLDTLSLEHSTSGDVDLADQPAGELTPLFRSERTTALRSLSLDSFPFPSSVEQAFADSALGPLDHFEIDGWCDPPVSDYPALLSSPALAGVKSLKLPTLNKGATEVAKWIGRNGELRQLQWGGRDFTAATVAALAKSAASQSLRRVKLDWMSLNVSGVKDLAGSSWPHLAELVCKYGEDDGRAVAKLIDHPHFARLTHLDVDFGPWAADLWKAVAKSKTVGRFHKLRLGFAITDAQLNALLDNPEVCKIGHLALPNRVKIDRKTQRRYEKVFGVKITRDW